MQLNRLELHDFRNYEHAETEFSPGLNMIVGWNGQGKTNLLESIRILCGMASHRAASVTSLLRHGAQQAVVRGGVEVRERKLQIDAEIRAPGGVRMKVNGSAVEGSKQHVLPASVLFSPDDLALIKGGPEGRRHFFDDIASQTNPLAGADRTDFERTLRQRNGLLKAAQISSRARVQLEVWTAQFAAAAARVVCHRLEVLQSIRHGVAQKYPEVAGRAAPVTMVYQPTWAEQATAASRKEIEQAMNHALEASLQRDLERGVTQMGPHRDDIDITLDGVHARAFASQGEQRSLALSMRLAERQLLAEARDELPILLLDDIFSELDHNRRRRVAEVVRSGGQSFLTTTEPDGVPLTADQVVRVAEGRVRRDA